MGASPISTKITIALRRHSREGYPSPPRGRGETICSGCSYGQVKTCGDSQLAPIGAVRSRLILAPWGSALPASVAGAVRSRPKTCVDRFYNPR